MSLRYFDKFDETVFKTVLPNGLTVMFVPKNEYHRTYGVLSTHFGSVHQIVQHKATQEIRHIPAGAAHFLEHKLFEGPNGQDAFALFMQQGAMANAYTSYIGTSYLFSASEAIEQNIETLLDFVQTPTFTVEGIEKEKGIILQELGMYNDNPMHEIQQRLQQTLYPEHSAGVDILGTQESIQAMSYEDLMLCYESFYHPSNMNLIVVGRLDQEKLLKVIENNQAKKHFNEPEYVLVEEPVETPVGVSSVLERPLSQPLVECGWRIEQPVPQGSELFRHRLVGSCFFELLIGPTSSAYDKWYRAELVDANFSYNFVADVMMHHLVVAGSTTQPEATLQAWESALSNWRQSEDFTQEHLDLVLKGRIGDVLQSFNTLEYIAYDLIEGAFNDYELFDMLEVLQSIQLEDIVAFGQRYVDQCQVAHVIMQPKDE